MQSIPNQPSALPPAHDELRQILADIEFYQSQRRGLIAKALAESQDASATAQERTEAELLLALTASVDALDGIDTATATEADIERLEAAVSLFTRQLAAVLRPDLLKCEPYRAPKLPGRNDTCPCGSGQKVKKCCSRSGKRPAFTSETGRAAAIKKHHGDARLETHERIRRRNVFACALRGAGLSLRAAAQPLGVDHSTVQRVAKRGAAYWKRALRLHCPSHPSWAYYDFHTTHSFWRWLLSPIASVLHALNYSSDEGVDTTLQRSNYTTAERCKTARPASTQDVVGDSDILTGYRRVKRRVDDVLDRAIDRALALWDERPGTNASRWEPNPFPSSDLDLGLAQPKL